MIFLDYIIDTSNMCATLNNHPPQARATLTNINSDKTRFIHLLLVLISVMEVVTLLMIHKLEYVFQIKQKP